MQLRRRLPGERAVALLFRNLFADAHWYAQSGSGQFPDGLPVYAHSEHYLELFAITLHAVQTAQQQRQAAATQAALAARPRSN